MLATDGSRSTRSSASVTLSDSGKVTFVNRRAECSSLKTCMKISHYFTWRGFVAENHDRICYGQIQYTVSGKGQSLTERSNKVSVYIHLFIFSHSPVTVLPWAQFHKAL